MRFRMTIKRRLALCIATTVTVTVILSGGLFVGNELMVMDQRMIQELSTLAGVVGNSATGAIEFADADTAKETLSRLSVNPHIKSAAIYDGENKVMATYQIQKNAEKTNETPDTFTAPEFVKTGEVFNSETLDVFHDIKSSNERIGDIYLESDLAARDAQMARYTSIIGFVILASISSCCLTSHC